MAGYQLLASEHEIQPIQVGQWTNQLLEVSIELFTDGKNSQTKDEGQAKEDELFLKISRPKMELQGLT